MTRARPQRARRAASRPRNPRLSHLDARGRPAMVDVGMKPVTHRVAAAEARVRLPLPVAHTLRASRHRTAKGPVFDTAILAGVMAAKRTHELIPFCHPLGVENCRITITHRQASVVVVRAEVSVHQRTGVEMEALTAVCVAALTIYDMCKALSHDIEITGVRLLAKSGGRRAFARASARTSR